MLMDFNFSFKCACGHASHPWYSNIMKWSMKWPKWKCFVHTHLFWPYMVSCGARQWPLNIRWRWCIPMCHWLHDITLSSNVLCTHFLQLCGLKNSRNSSRLNNRRCELSLKENVVLITITRNYLEEFPPFWCKVNAVHKIALLPREHWYFFLLADINFGWGHILFQSHFKRLYY